MLTVLCGSQVLDSGCYTMFHHVPCITLKTTVDNVVRVVGMPPWTWEQLLLLMVKGFMGIATCVVKLVT